MTNPDSIEGLVHEWETHEQQANNFGAAWYESRSRTALELGHPTLAYNIAKRGQIRFRENIDIGYLLALSLARGGSSGSAADQLKLLRDTMRADHRRYMEVLALSGRIAKDNYTKLKGGHRLRAAKQSAAYYTQAF